jgi:chitinase
MTANGMFLTDRGFEEHKLTSSRVSFDNSKTLKQKADFANTKCIGGLFGWTLDEGGPGSLANPNDLDPDDHSMDGACPDGSDSDTGDFYVDGSVVGSESNTATAIAPVNIIVAPSTLASPTTFSVEPLVTPVKVTWTTTKTVTISGQPNVTNTVARTVQTTTFAMPTITASVIPWCNWNITATDVTHMPRVAVVSSSRARTVKSRVVPCKRKLVRAPPILRFRY